MNGGMAARSSDESTSTSLHCAMNLLCSVTHRSRSASSPAKRITMACRLGLARPPTQLSGWFSPVSPSISARATMPCLNSSGNVASEPSSTPSARRPFQVKATVTQRLSFSTEARTSAADCAFSRMADSQARPPAALRNERNSYRPVSAGVRVSRICWMSSFSSMARPAAASLHLVEHVRKVRLDLERFLDFVGAHVGILAVFQEAWALVLANELDEGRSIRLPVRRKALEVLEDGVDAVLRKERHSILGVFVKIGVEDALIHEIGLPFDREENPAQVVQLKHGEAVRLLRYGLLDVSGVLVEYIFPARDDLGDDGEAIARGTLGKDLAVSALLHLVFEDPSFRDRHRRRSGPVALLAI